MFWLGMLAGGAFVGAWVLIGGWMSTRMPYQDPLDKYSNDSVWDGVLMAFVCTALLILFPFLWTYGWYYRQRRRWRRRRAARRAVQDEA